MFVLDITDQFLKDYIRIHPFLCLLKSFYLLTKLCIVGQTDLHTSKG